MTPARRHSIALGVSALACCLLSGCGVQLQSVAQPVPANVIPDPLRLPAPSPTIVFPSTGSQVIPDRAHVRLWFVEEDGLASVGSDLPMGTAADLVLQALAVGPTAQQSDQGLRTVASDPLTGLPFVSAAASVVTASAPSTAESPGGPTTGASATAPVAVSLSPAFAALPPVEQVLLLGQVVLSLTSSGASSVTFTDEIGTPLAVPLPDGRLLDAPAAARDYTGLIVRP